MSLLDHDDEVEMVPAPTPMTEEEFLCVEGKAEWVEGVTYFMSPVSLDHDDVGGWLYSVMRILGEEKSLGWVTGDDVAIRFRSRQMRCPDVAFFGTANSAKRERNRVVGVPDLIAEVISPDSIERDYVDKFRLYESQGVREYLIVDVLKRTATLYRLAEGGTYQEVAPADGKLASVVIPGFFFRAQWLASPPLPSPYRIVREMGVA